MSYLDQIQQSIDYIEDHLTEPLCVHDLAARIGFSPYHYYRIFGAYVGMPVMEFVRRRRLAHAAASLTSDRRILDIALDYGFQTHAGFTKAFLKVYGLPPERYRLHASARIPERVELSRFLEYKLKGGIIVEPRLLERSSFTIAGYVLETTTENGQNLKDIPRFWQEYLGSERAKHLHSQPNIVEHTLYGVCLDMNIETNHFNYYIGLEVSDISGLDPELKTATIPAATYAVFTTPPTEKNSLSPHIQNTWAYIYNEWFPRSGHEFAAGCADFERYDDRSLSESKAVAEIWIPIVKKP
ncbi:MAG: AraC family transcriptional regulator [Firmicutes bacterium]|nr:AraC family transcriptional regulator [Bacillota bacterium]